MYEPIYVEALTDWLNERGLRVPVTVRVTSRKKRGRGAGVDGEGRKSGGGKKGKGKGDGDGKEDRKVPKQVDREEITNNGSGRESEMVKPDEEVRLEFRDLSPWMVRKWCQEFSVCCVWRDGGHGWGRK